MSSPPSPISPAPRPGPLSGLLVADFSRVLAGPYATMLLADLGADVIKVESPGGDDTRRWSPAGHRRRHVHLFPGHQPQQALGRARPARPRPTAPPRRSWPAAPTSSWRTSSPAGCAKFGLDYETVSAGNPGIMYASISGFGAGPGQGPARLRPHRAGRLRADEPDRRRRRAAVPGRRPGLRRIAGLHTTIGILAALEHRPPPARASMSRPACSPRRCPAMVNQASAVAAAGVVPIPDGQRAPQPVPLRVAAHRRRRAIVIAAGNDTQFRRLCEVLGAPSWPTTPGSTATRTAPCTAPSSRPLLTERLRQRTASAEWFTG